MFTQRADIGQLTGIGSTIRTDHVAAPVVADPRLPGQPDGTHRAVRRAGAGGGSAGASPAMGHRAIEDGVYELFYGPDGSPCFDSLLLVMRRGQLIGADRWGGLVTGRAEPDGRGRHRFLVSFDIPQGGILATGAVLSSTVQTFELVADLGEAPYKAAGSLDLMGKRISLELVYRGPVPLPRDGRKRAAFR